MRESKKIRKKLEFLEKHKNLSEEEYKMELLYSQQLIFDKVSRIKADVSFITWVIVIVIVLSLTMGFLGFLY